MTRSLPLSLRYTVGGFSSFFSELHPSTTHPHARAFIHFAPYHLHVHCYLCFPLIFHRGVILSSLARYFLFSA